MARLVIAGATLLDTAPRQPSPVQKTLVIEDDRIVDLVEPGKTVAGDTLDGRGAWVIPGLVDMHFHPFLVDSDPKMPRHMVTMARNVQLALNNLKVWLESGVTTIRAVGTHENLDLDLRDLAKAGRIRSPRIVACGYLIAMTAGPRLGNESTYLEINGPDDARRVAREQIKAGVDWLKIYAASTLGGGGGRLIGPPGWPQMNEDEIRAIVEEGVKAGLQSCAHAVSVESVKNCLRAGVQCIEHATELDDEAIAMLKASATPIVPTLAIAWSLAAFGLERGFPEHLARLASSQLEAAKASVRRARQAGIRIAAGTDADNTRCLLREECRLLVDCGLTPYEALQSATIRATEILQMADRLGSLRPGAVADLVLLNADPLADIRHLAQVRGVVQGGKVEAWKT